MSVAQPRADSTDASPSGASPADASPADGSPADRSPLTVGFIGAGSMGAPMVERLLAAGHAVHLYARRSDVSARFTDLGAQLGSSATAVAGAADVLIVCPFSQAQLFEILVSGGALAAMRPGSVLVQHATVSPTAVRELAAQAAAGEVAVLDAPVSGTSDSIRAGRLTVLVGGDKDAADLVEPLLGAYSATVVRTGEVGSASIVKLVNNLTFAAHVQTAIAADTLGRSLGLDTNLLMGALSVCSANSAAIQALGILGSPEAFAQFALPYLRKDVALIEQVAADLGLDVGLLGDIVRNGPAVLTGDS
ncbi:NAD(P)-dependent oxidoreductase [Frankia gtarii]|uniref:NAD(P)-dependent oxidoreductase n=1 Tax=Frankia gtarii TaxID=2950102 RepID=UPI0021C07432|nr:NAD(P)-dependent oxidoreductase [Frankia gtarii]